MKFPLGMAYFRRYMGNDLKASKFCGAFLQFTVTNSRVSNFGDHHTPPKKTKKTMELTTTNPLSSKNPIQNIPRARTHYGVFSQPHLQRTVQCSNYQWSDAIQCLAKGFRLPFLPRIHTHIPDGCYPNVGMLLSVW